MLHRFGLFPVIAMNEYEDIDKFLDWEEMLENNGRSARNTSGKPGKAKKKSAVPAMELTDFIDDAAQWVPSYARALDPRHHERTWLIESVSQFYRDNTITDVTRRVKGGKEANVYCCIGHPATGMDLIAAKLYRPRMLRTLKNDAIYKSGRQLRDEAGKQLKGRREKLALQQKTTFGKHLDMVWWIGNEFRVQNSLYEAGAAVPRPIGHNGNTILMAYIGDEWLAAPALSDVSLERAEASDLFDSVMHNARLMLENHYVHGDLSAFNILYWDGKIWIIDFPQVVDARINPNARMLLGRDIKRVCDYFGRFGIRSDPERITRELWIPYMGDD